MKTKYYTLLLLMFCFTFSVSAQQQLTKLSKKIDVTKDVNIDLNTSYVEIEIDTWNKNTLEVEAYIEGEKLSKEELQEALKHWDLKVEGSGDYVKISSEGSHSSWSNHHSLNLKLEDLNLDLESLKSLEDLNLFIAEMPEMPEMPELPEMPEIAHVDMPELPDLPELPEGVTNVSFDTEAYEKDGEAYLNKWSKEFEEEYGKEYGEKMKAWGRKMAKIDFSRYEHDMEEWGERFGEEYGEKMEAWGKEFEHRFDDKWAEKMEAWGEKYGKEMEERALVMEKRMEAREKSMNKRAEAMEKRHEERAHAREKRHEAHERRSHSRAKLHLRGGNVKKTIKIKMPKKAKLKMNVRHGELKMSSVINNLKADISHGVFVANHIDGSETSINVSYSPIDINTWSLGELNIKYVEDAHIQTVESMMLNSISSDIVLSNLLSNAIIDGSFGDLTIDNIADSFSNLNIVLDNSDALLALPKSDYTLFYKGNRSKLNNEMTSQKTIENYPNGKNIVKAIVLNAKYSDIILKN